VGPRKALVLAAAAQLAGAMLLGVAVARTIGEGIVDATAITTPVIVATLTAALAWHTVTWYLGLPSSSSHALIGALVGAAWLHSGPDSVSLYGLGVVLLVLFLSPWIGFVASYVGMKLLLFLLQGASVRVGAYLKHLQWVPAAFLAAGIGANGAQMVMGILALGLLSLGLLPAFSIPTGVRLAAALSLAAGTALGGMRIVRTLGLRLYRMRPIHGLSSQSAAALVVVGASVLGGPVSVTQIVGASITGAGAAHRISQVRWGIIGNIIAAWLLTIPAAAGLAALVCWIVVQCG
jgi:PiT family inorganic phosphate transporter